MQWKFCAAAHSESTGAAQVIQRIPTVQKMKIHHGIRSGLP
jgi:hypothetical protein